MSEKQRIARYLASCGFGSRRDCEDLIRDGSVQVNGKTTVDVACSVDPGKDRVVVDNKQVRPYRKVYYLLNKPAGYTSTTRDAHADKVITDLVPDDPPVWPVGRLDRETTGLIILTNDGDLTQQLTHPRFEHEKEYYVLIDSPLSPAQQEKIKSGIMLDDGMIHPDDFEEIGSGRYRIVLHEGRKRIVRRIIEYFKKKVISLERVRISSITLGDLKEGEYKGLSKVDIDGLLR